MMGQRFAFSEAPLKRIREVQFGVMSPEEIVRIKLAPNYDSSHSLTLLLYRKRIRLRKLSFLRLWMSLANAQNLED